MQTRQNWWPQGKQAGSSKTSRQMEHVSSSRIFCSVEAMRDRASPPPVSAPPSSSQLESMCALITPTPTLRPQSGQSTWPPGSAAGSAAPSADGRPWHSRSRWWFSACTCTDLSQAGQISKRPLPSSLCAASSGFETFCSLGPRAPESPAARFDGSGALRARDGFAAFFETGLGAGGLLDAGFGAAPSLFHHSLVHIGAPRPARGEPRGRVIPAGYPSGVATVSSRRALSKTLDVDVATTRRRR
mmetsp:Transcript_15311/g.51500  ORF Transcript_15311/g.51500 Transcript_15311/m.51500 type:complete len:244 (-) Transcript_15311:13-744(-)